MFNFLQGAEGIGRHPIEYSTNYYYHLMDDDWIAANYDRDERLWAPRFPAQPVHECQYDDLYEADLCIICCARYKSYRLECGHLFCLECVQHSHKGYSSDLRCSVCFRILKSYDRIAPHRSNYNAFVPIYERYYPGRTICPPTHRRRDTADDASAEPAAQPTAAHIVRELNTDMWTNQCNQIK